MTLEQQIDTALDTIRPYLKTDGGDVRVVEVTPEGVVRLELLGSCETCPMSTMTMKAGVEEAILRAVPEVKAVEAINVMTSDPRLS